MVIHTLKVRLRDISVTKSEITDFSVTKSEIIEAVTDFPHTGGVYDPDLMVVRTLDGIGERKQSGTHYACPDNSIPLCNAWAGGTWANCEQCGVGNRVDCAAGR